MSGDRVLPRTHGHWQRLSCQAARSIHRPLPCDARWELARQVWGGTVGRGVCAETQEGPELGVSESLRSGRPREHGVQVGSGEGLQACAGWVLSEARGR